MGNVMGKRSGWGSNGRQAQSTPGQGADQEQLQQVAMAIDRAASLPAGPIDQALGGIEAHGARGDLLIQAPTSHRQQLIAPVEGARATGRSQRERMALRAKNQNSPGSGSSGRCP